MKKAIEVAVHPDESRSSSSSDSNVQGVTVRNAIKSYGVGRKRTAILKGFDMNVKKGSIYGLLGASGCGKTTLLSCIVGRRSLDSGEVLVFGGEPGSSESGIPGPGVGYMPQELALYGEFTIQETLEYFGRIYRLSQTFVKSQMEFLSKMLDLPPSHRFVKSLSGGQQRRVSFAVALFHDPKLLILDEPTVGVDPLLRRSIWNHLVCLSTDHGRTVIITTHYIEEARQANTIGMMRSGRLLAEESPKNLLRIYGIKSLEDVFLKLCMKDNDTKETDNTTNGDNLTNAIPRVGRVNMVGHENKAFNHSISQFDVSQLTIERQQHRNNQSHPGSLANYSSPASKSTLPTVANDGIVGLAFNPYGETRPTFNKGELDNRSSHSKKNRAHLVTNGLTFDSKNEFLNLERGPSSATVVGTLDHRKPDNNLAVTPRTKPGRSRTFRVTMPSFYRTAALIRKNFMQLFRNYGMFVFVFFLPAIQSLLFCLCIGHNPFDLKMGIVNEEIDSSQERTCNYTADCTLSMFSCRFLRFMSNETFIQVPFKSLSEAQEATRRGQVWGVIHMKQNFTDSLIIRQADGSSSDNDTILASQINVNLDFSNQQIALIIHRRLHEAFENFTHDLMEACDYEAEAARFPLTFVEPIFGNEETSYTEFMAPGMILSVVYFMAIALTSGLLISERKEGLLDRSIVAGVQMSEVLLAHFVNQFTVLVGQTALVFILILSIFQIPCVGNVALALLITIVQGVCGMAFGFVISAICESEVSAIHLALGSFYPTILIGGIIWPVEGMPHWMRILAYALPQTYSIEALRSIFARGWGFEIMDVSLGLITGIAWTVGMLVLSIVMVRLRKHIS